MSEAQFSAAANPLERVTVSSISAKAYILMTELERFPVNHNVSALLYDRQLEVLYAGDSHGSVHLYSAANPSVQLLTSFVSHISDFDRDTIQHESDSIAALESLYRLPAAYALLATNEKAVKLWHTGVKAKCRRVFQGGHEFRIHSVSANCTKTQFLSCDDLTLNLWDLERTESTYRAADHKPFSIKDLKEVLLHAAFHPYNSSVLLTTSTGGTVRIGDLRARARLTSAAMELRRPRTKDSHYSDVLTSITGAEFALSGDYLYSRDFQNVYFWDLRSPLRPAATQSVTSDLRCVLTAFSSAEGIGKFEVRAVAEGCVTGGYGGEVLGFGHNGGQNSVVAVSFPTSLPHIVTSSLAVFIAVNNSIRSLPLWPHFSH